jgi:hypothetical protein
MAPASLIRYVDPFSVAEPASSDQGPDKQDNPQQQWEDPLTLFATATAEFLFLTRNIETFGKSVTNWNEPLRVTPAHWEDIESMLHRVEIKVSAGIHQSMGNSATQLWR